MMMPGNVVLIGFMGTGKSAIGSRASQHLGLHFYDADAEIERRAGKPIARIFAEDGEAAFRDAETTLLQEWIQSVLSGALIATGGGMPLRPENAALLRQIGKVIWLHAAPEAILTRIGPDLSLRPLLAEHQAAPLVRIQELLAAREAHYAAAAHLRWETSPYASPDEAAAALAEMIYANSTHCDRQIKRNELT